MDDDGGDMKWLMIACGIMFIALFGSIAVLENAKYGAIAECYKAGGKDCQNLR